MIRLGLALAAIVGVGVLAAVVVTASGDEPDRPPMPDPLGISPKDATRISNPEKRALWATEYSARATAAAGPDPRENRRPSVSERPPGVAPTEVPYTAGITDRVNSFGGFNFSNGYEDHVAGEQLQVFAGSTRDDKTLGAIVIVTTALTGKNTRNGGVYYAPGNLGALRIESFEGPVLHLSAENGARLTFDLDTRTFAPE